MPDTLHALLPKTFPLSWASGNESVRSELVSIKGLFLKKQ